MNGNMVKDDWMQWEHGEGWLDAWLEEMKDAGVLD